MTTNNCLDVQIRPPELQRVDHVLDGDSLAAGVVGEVDRIAQDLRDKLFDVAAHILVHAGADALDAPAARESPD